MTPADREALDKIRTLLPLKCMECFGERGWQMLLDAEIVPGRRMWSVGVRVTIRGPIIRVLETAGAITRFCWEGWRGSPFEARRILFDHHKLIDHLLRGSP